uniref:Uncharacterized protein n=1 Tax=Knipowitschia caucasica TaxID=637954 RepID=A0AAV2M6B0_KNICA
MSSVFLRTWLRAFRSVLSLSLSIWAASSTAHDAVALATAAPPPQLGPHVKGHCLSSAPTLKDTASAGLQLMAVQSSLACPLPLSALVPSNALEHGPSIKYAQVS